MLFLECGFTKALTDPEKFAQLGPLLDTPMKTRLASGSSNALPYIINKTMMPR
jgi:hypothetical protein